MSMPVFCVLFVHTGVETSFYALFALTGVGFVLAGVILRSGTQHLAELSLFAAAARRRAIL